MRTFLLCSSLGNVSTIAPLLPLWQLQSVFNDRRARHPFLPAALRGVLRRQERAGKVLSLYLSLSLLLCCCLLLCLCILGVLFEQLIVQLIGVHIVRILFEQFWDCSNNEYYNYLLSKMSNIEMYLVKKVKFWFSFICILSMLS
jgi:hypothetical protein